MASVSIAVFWLAQASALPVFLVPFSWGLVALWAASHFIRAIGLTLAYHRYYAHRAFQMHRVVRLIDVTYYVILAMRAAGLAWDVQPVPERIYREARQGLTVLPAPEEDGLEEQAAGCRP